MDHQPRSVKILNMDPTGKAPKTPDMEPGSQSSPGPTSRPLRFLGQTHVLGAQIAQPNVLTIGTSSAMLEQTAASRAGGICSCAMAASREEAGRLGAWKNTSWEPVIFTPSSASLKRLPGRVWMCSGWSTGYLRCANCGGRSAVVSAELSGVVLVTKLQSTFPSTRPKKGTKLAP